MRRDYDYESRRTGNGASNYGRNRNYMSGGSRGRESSGNYGGEQRGFEDRSDRPGEGFYGGERDFENQYDQYPRSGEGRRQYGEEFYGGPRGDGGNFGRQWSGRGEREYGRQSRGGGYWENESGRGYGRQYGGQNSGRAGGVGNNPYATQYGGSEYGSSELSDRRFGQQYGSGQYGSGLQWGESQRGLRTGMESGQYGQHYGRGPKNYKRSDQRIEEEINDRLTAHSGIDASEMEVKVQNGEVTLTGTVDDRNGKRMAEDLVENVQGVTQIHNQLRVQNNQQGGSQSNRSNQGSSSSTRKSAGSESHQEEPVHAGSRR